MIAPEGSRPAYFQGQFGRWVVALTADHMRPQLRFAVHFSAALFVTVVLVGYMFWFGLHNRMDTVLPNPLTTRSTQLGAAISDVAYGLDLKHAANAKIVNFLSANGISDQAALLAPLGASFPEITKNTKILNRAILDATRLEGIDNKLKLSDDTLAFTKMEDLGIIDYYKLSFRLFGYDIAGFYYTYFVFLASTIAIFYFGFWNRLGILAIFNVLLVGEVFAVEYIAYHSTNPDLLTVHSGRFLSLLAVVPAFHLFVSLWRPGPFDVKKVVWVAIQVFFLAFVISIRNSALWAVIVLGGSIGAMCAWAVWRNWSNPVKLLVRQVIQWPLVVMLIAAAASQVYIASQVHPAYKVLDELLPTHYTYHSLAMGLGFGDGYGRPTLDDVAPELKGARSDPLGSQTAEVYMEKISGFKFLQYFPSNVLPMYGRPKTYERVLQAAYIDFVKEHPAFWLRLTFNIKPVMVMRLASDSFTGIVWQDRRRMAVGLIFLLISLQVIRWTPEERSDYKFGLVGIAGLAAAACLPAIIAFPAVHTFADTFALISTVAVGLFVLVAQAMLAKVRQCREIVARAACHIS